MGRRFRHRFAEPEPEEHRINHRIRISQIRVIDAGGEQLGIMTPDEGRAIAREQGLDLVEVAPDVRPPVCRIMDYGKFKYQRAKKTTKRSVSEIKTVQLRPKTGEHDLNTKLGRALEFLERGDKVRLVMRLRGREQAYPQRWIALLHGHYEQRFAEVSQIASAPSRQGRAITMLLEPNPT